ncbi:TetR/AcrR family transcriptional regulator [Clostridium felsineum]|uniref:TetR/AcrR family transcriptional regulator n=1 Tax=Clostridium felsineum TaxID=36839 RepID=UPI00098C3B4B|nr:TetR/AcrR family transcriptional regulator [Clostridium felsineum]URZ18481.1 hypothetical protein CLFE_045690 [Clostridium felsineum DSM 794]
MRTKNKGNAVSNRSKICMEKALLKLMETEDYNEITIQEITDNAGLSRRTFYRNYLSKEEILEDYFHRIWSEYEAKVCLQTDLSLPNIAKIFFSVMSGNLDFLKIVNRHNLLPLFLSQVDELLPSTFNELKGKYMSFSKESIKYALIFSTGGCMRILVQWLNASTIKSPEEMFKITKDIVSIFNYPNC